MLGEEPAEPGDDCDSLIGVTLDPGLARLHAVRDYPFILGKALFDHSEPIHLLPDFYLTLFHHVVLVHNKDVTSSLIQANRQVGD